MLDSETKRRIDSCRDILVGKVPDPKSQVEQITIALIYKFMDDMDIQAAELGGERTFFAGEFEKYSWVNLMAPGTGGHDILALYGEAIQRMTANPGIPTLFRDIFKNAYLPYRDPETLRAFLKEINHFTYDHSEKLGDAFEYLLSVLGSQGDAGQFRTPRHIIDFMVEVIDPKKNETILDPACGTAGFLISAWKHIQKANGKKKPGDQLTPDERKALIKNVRGYDISPDMVRLSLVNLYLHGFTDPHIYEYDTLTSDERWNEYADAILANPPFMSPKGGIKPHKRFSVQSKRSEVLFVDYMAEHLSPNGRAAIIVPEGIIFQSGTAYKQLRKMLVGNYLAAVVSLPAGVFNPYSGVKTSILFFDKQVAKKSDEILFVKVENDGFGLGAQRRPIALNDLPEAARNLRGWLDSVHSGEVFAGADGGGLLAVKRERIAEDGEFNLSGERYRDSVARLTAYEMVALGDICKPEYGFTEKAQDSGDARFVRITDIDPNGKLRKNGAKFINLSVDSKKYILKNDDVLVARTGATFGKTMIFKGEYDAVFASFLIRLKFPLDRVLPEFYWAFAQTPHYWEQANALVTGGGQPQFNGNALKKVRFPLPPLDVQKEIVADIDGYQLIIDGARQVVDNYRPQIDIDPEWPVVELSTLADKEKNSLKAGPFGSALKKEFYIDSGYKIYGQEQVIRNDATYGDYYISEDKFKSLESCKVKKGDVLISLVGTYGKTLIIPDDFEPGIINPRLMKISFAPSIISPDYFVFAFNQDAVNQQLDQLSYGGTMNILSLKVLKGLNIPLPNLKTQQKIVARIEAEQKLVDANKELIRIFEAKVKTTIDRVWGEA